MFKKRKQETMGYFGTAIYPSTKEKLLEIKASEGCTWDELFSEFTKLYESSK